MPEELREDSLGYLSRDDPATLAAWGEATQLVDRIVEDVNGQRLGKVVNCFAEEGAIVRCDIKIDKNAKGIYNIDRDVAGIPPHWIADIKPNIVKLNKAAEQVFHPEDPRPAHANEDNGGAPELPRKIR